MSAEVEPARLDSPLAEDGSPQDLNGVGGSDNDEDLFGDDDDEPIQPSDTRRRLDDSELDSGDDEHRDDRLAPTVEDDEPQYEEQKQMKLLDVDIARINRPEGDELFLVQIPEFLGIKHKSFDYATYEPPTKPHDGSSTKFSPFSTANTSIFWRRDPQNPENIQSNARFIRWSDGSFTLQLASKPTEQYRISATALRAGWPKKQQEHYDPNGETHEYLGAPHATPGVDVQIVAPFDARLKIQPTGDTADEAVRQLKQSIAARSEVNDAPTSFKSTRTDPELAKKQAEQAEKDVAKAARRREAAAERQLGRKDKVMGRSGLGRSSGLTIGGLEDDMPTARGSKAQTKRRRPNRHGEILSDDESAGGDEYDRGDDFLVPSDEEPETYEDDELEDLEAEDDPDRDDLDIPGRKTVVNSRTRGGGRDRERTPKRARDEDDEDAEAEEDPEIRRPAPRKQPRLFNSDESE